MNRAQLYLWSVVHAQAQAEENVFPDVAGQVSSQLPIADKELRKSDMEAAIGAWAGRADLPDSLTYISSLRNEVRGERVLRA